MPDAISSEARVAVPSPTTSGIDAEAGSVETGALRDNMRLVYQRARAKSPQLGALLNSGCDIIKADGQEVVIGFRFRNHADKASEKANLDILRAIVADLTGQDSRVTCRHEEGVSDWKQREVADRSPLVRAAQEMGARILTQDPEDRA
jgi:hypothetical protein